MRSSFKDDSYRRANLAVDGAIPEYFRRATMTTYAKRVGRNA
jgi:hypothetical protein